LAKENLFELVCPQYKCRELYSLALYPFRALTSCVVVTSVSSSSLMRYRFIARQFNWQKNGESRNTVEWDSNLPLKITIFQTVVVVDIMHCQACIFVTLIFIP